MGPICEIQNENDLGLGGYGDSWRSPLNWSHWKGLQSDQNGSELRQRSNQVCTTWAWLNATESPSPQLAWLARFPLSREVLLRALQKPFNRPMTLFEAEILRTGWPSGCYTTSRGFPHKPTQAFPASQRIKLFFDHPVLILFLLSGVLENVSKPWNLTFCLIALPQVAAGSTGTQALSTFDNDLTEYKAVVFLSAFCPCSNSRGTPQ